MEKVKSPRGDDEILTKEKQINHLIDKTNPTKGEIKQAP